MLKNLTFSYPSHTEPDSFQSPPPYVILHFLHGSKPAKGHKHHESKWFGGKHGGHVYIQIDEELFSFYPDGSFHILAHRKELHGAYYAESYVRWSEDTVQMKFTSIVIPTDSVQYQRLLEIRDAYLTESPYDYAFFGMRCASAAYDVLGYAGILKQRNRAMNIVLNFYPKPLRRRVENIARKENWMVFRKDGRQSRRWEN